MAKMKNKKRYVARFNKASKRMKAINRPQKAQRGGIRMD